MIFKYKLHAARSSLKSINACIDFAPLLSRTIAANEFKTWWPLPDGMRTLNSTAKLQTQLHGSRNFQLVSHVFAAAFDCSPMLSWSCNLLHSLIFSDDWLSAVANSKIVACTVSKADVITSNLIVQGNFDHCGVPTVRCEGQSWCATNYFFLISCHCNLQKDLTNFHDSN